MTKRNISKFTRDYQKLSCMFSQTKGGLNRYSTPLFDFGINEFLHGFYIDRSRAFFALLDIKAYPLAFLQGSETLHTDS